MVWSDSFEAGIPAGWTIGNGVWVAGIPTAGPQAAYDGVNVAGTTLNASYAANADSQLISPSFVVPPLGQMPRLRFWHWYAFGTGGAGEVQISVAGGPWGSLAAFSGAGPFVWSRPAVDLSLSGYAGHTVRLAFRFHTSAAASSSASGWFVDQVELITGASESTFLPTNLAANWKFEEASGSVAADFVGEHPGTLLNYPVREDGLVGRAIRFVGGSYMSVPASPAWGFGNSDFTIELWALFHAKDGGTIGNPQHVMIGCDEGGGNRNKWFFAYGGGYLYFHLNSPSIGPKFFPQVRFSPVLEVWYHLAIVRAGTTYTLYVNGAPAGVAVNADVIPLPNAPLTLGQAESLGFANATLDEVAVYRRALSQAEIRQIVRAEDAGVIPPPIPPLIVTPPASQTVLAGANATFAVVASGNPAPTYQWLRNGSPISGATAATLVLPAVTAASAGSYAVTVANASGAVTSIAADLIVATQVTLGFSEVPTATPLAFNATYAEKGVVALSKSNNAQIGNPLNVGSGNNFLYFHGANEYIEFSLSSGAAFNLDSLKLVTNAFAARWISTSKSGGQISLGSPTTLTLIPFSSAAFRGITWFRIGTPGNATQVDDITVSQVPPVPVVLVQPKPQATTPGGAVSFTVDANGAAPLAYQWRKSGQPITTNPSAATATLTLASPALADAGGYDCVVSNLQGSVTTERVALTVSDDVTMTFEDAVAGTVLPFNGTYRESGIVATAKSNNAQIGDPLHATVGNNFGYLHGNGEYLEFSLASGAPFTVKGFELTTNGFGSRWIATSKTGGQVSIPGPTSVTGTTLSGSQYEDVTWFRVGSFGAATQVDNVELLAGPIAPVPPVIVRQPSSMTAIPGRVATLSVVATGGAPAYQWRKGSVAVAGATGATLTFLNVTAAQAGTYDVVVVNGYGSVTSTAAVLSVATRADGWRNLEDFETGWDDWYAENYTLWQVGKPMVGPPYVGGSRARSPVNAAATGVSTNYPAGLSGRLISPAIQVPNVAASASVVLRFWQWYQYGTGDSGQVQVSVWNGTDWSSWLGVSTPAATGTSSAWGEVLVDLTAYQGQLVRVGFLHTANGDSSVGKGWLIDDVSLSSAVPVVTSLGATTTGTFTAANGRQYFVVDVPPGGSLRVTLLAAGGLGSNGLYLKRGELPTAGSYDARYSTAGANQTVTVPNAGAGKWYILADNIAGDLPAGFTLQTEFVGGVQATAASPAVFGNGGSATLTIDGASFEPDTAVSLNRGGGSVAAQAVSLVSASRVFAEFAGGLAPGAYDVVVTSHGTTAILPNAVTVVAAGEPRFEARLIVPGAVGRHAPGMLYIEYANRGTVAMPAPLLVLTGTQRPFLRLAEGLSAQDLLRAFWTSESPAGWSSAVQCLAAGESPGVLQPGESGRVAVHYAGLQAPWDFSLGNVRFDLGVLDANNPTAVDWASLKASLRPTSVPADAWDAIWSNFVAAAGSTWGDYVRMLNANAVYLRNLGIDVKSLDSLLAFAIAQADGVNLVRTVASATDAVLTAPGMGLAWSRAYPVSLSARHRLGTLGRGWAHNWELSLSIAPSGAVTLVGPGGSQRVFESDSRTTGAYFSQTGDHGTLRKSGTNYVVTEPGGTSATFGSDGKLVSVQDLNGNRITATYTGGVLTTLAHSGGPSLTLAYAAGLLQTVTDSAGRVTTYTYDATQHLTKVRRFDGSEIQYEYATGLGATREHALTRLTEPGGTHRDFAYDAQGRLASFERDASAERVSFAHDGFGAVTMADAEGHGTRYYYDHRGLLAKVQNPFGAVVRNEFDEEYNLRSMTDPAGRSHTFAYDAAGNLIDAIDPLGGRSRFFYGAFNRLVALYDAKNNLTRYTYDANGNPTATIYADNSAEHWTYTSAGLPATWTNCRTNAVSYTYNVAGRTTAKIFPDGTRADYTYDARGNLVSAANPVGAITLTYDASDRLRRITYPGSRWLEYTYDAAGRRQSMLDQLGYRLDYGYDAAGRLQTLTDATGLQVARYDYGPAGRIARKTLGNGVCTTYDYDAAGQLTRLVNRKPDAAELSHFNYTYDGRGRRIEMATHYGTWTYGYDDLGQLTRALLVSTDPAVPDQDLTYVYDAMGNRVRTIENGVTTEYTTNNLNQYVQVGAETLTYDADGSLTSKKVGTATTLSLTSNVENRVTGYTSAAGQRQFQYDALGFPAVVVRDGVTNWQVHDYRNHGALIARYASDGTRSGAYAHGFGFLSFVQGQTCVFSTFDPIGNWVNKTNGIGEEVGWNMARPFGEKIAGSGSSFALGDLGEFGSSEEAELVLMGARFYNGRQGRFTARDPLGIVAGIGQYSYCLNNPISASDSSGLAYEIVVDNNLASGSGHYNPKTRNIEIASDVKNHVLTHEFVHVFQYGIMDVLGVPYKTLSAGPAAAEFGRLMEVPAAFAGELRAILDGDVQGILGEYDYMKKWLEDPYGALRDQIKNKPSPPAAALTRGVSATPAAQDPNALTGPAGFGSRNYVSSSALLPYRVDFENAATASAPAQVVTLSNPLPEALEGGTLELTEVGWGDFFFPIPAGSQHYEHTEHVTQAGVAFDVHVDVAFNPSTRTVTARFDSLDPLTGLPPPVSAGFLPPEDGTGRGKGHVSYVVRPKAALPTDTEIRNVGFITFDPEAGGAVYRTDLVDPHDPASPADPNRQALVTIDADAPSGAMTALPPGSVSTTFSVGWSGTDVGAGVTGYDVYARVDNGAWELWQSNTAQTSAEYSGSAGHSYAFFAVSRDGAGRVSQAAPDSANPGQTQTFVLRPQTIVFPSPSPKTFGDAPFVLTASAASGLPVSYALVSGPALVNGSSVTITGAGTIVLRATQSGNGTFAPAPAVDTSVTVAKAAAAIEFQSLQQAYTGAARVPSVTTNPAGLAVTLAYPGRTTPPVYPGTYPVSATVADMNYAGTTTATVLIATTVLVRHAPTVGGSLDGSLQLLSGENVSLPGGALISGDLLVPGSPTVQANGSAGYLAHDGEGAADPANYAVALGSDTAVRYVVRRVDPVALPNVVAPLPPAGTRDVVLGTPAADPGNFATIRNLVLNGTAGEVAIPPGAYGRLTATGSGNAFVLGHAGAIEPELYELQSLTLNAGRIRVVGPVRIVLAAGATVSGATVASSPGAPVSVSGDAAHPGWLRLEFAAGGLTLNGNVGCFASVAAPSGTVAVNSNATFVGDIACDRLSLAGQVNTP